MQIILSKQEAEAILAAEYRSRLDSDPSITVSIECPKETVYVDQRPKVTSNVLPDDIWHKIISRIRPEDKIAMIRIVRCCIDISIPDAKNFVERHMGIYQQ